MRNQRSNIVKNNGGLSKLILVPVFIFLFISCTSPLDVDTPRITDKIGGGEPFDVNISMIVFQENWHNRDIQIITKSAQIDTSWTEPRLYLDLDIDFKELDIPNYDKLSVETMDLKTEDMKMTAEPYYFKKNPVEVNEARFKVERGINIEDEVEVSADNHNNISEIAFNVDLARKEIWTKFNSKIYNQVVERKEKDTTVTVWVKEKRIDPIYDIHGNIIGYDTTEVDVPYPKDSTIVYMEATPDTLFLRGTIVFEW